MTVDRLPPQPKVHTRTGDALLDGVAAGVAGALTIVLGFLCLDLAAGRTFVTPALVGSLLLHGPAASPGVVVAPREVMTGIAFILVGCLVNGVLVSWLLTRSGRHPNAGTQLLVSFLCLQLSFFALDAASGARALERLRPWAVLGANALAAGAISLTLWKRLPRLIEGGRDLWDDEP